jgi:thioredoxin reductase
MLDVVIVGGGPAGLNAALMLGRARRSVLLCDSGQPRNARVHAMHGFLSRDRMDPAVLRQTARDQLQTYPTAQVRDITVQTAVPEGDRFTLTLGDGTSQQAAELRDSSTSHRSTWQNSR